MKVYIVIESGLYTSSYNILGVFNNLEKAKDHLNMIFEKDHTWQPDRTNKWSNAIDQFIQDGSLILRLEEYEVK